MFQGSRLEIWLLLLDVYVGLLLNVWVFDSYPWLLFFGCRVSRSGYANRNDDCLHNVCILS